MAQELTVGSLFAGIGGFDLGLERAGMHIRWQVEIDPYCQRVLAKHWPRVKRYGDIKAIDWSRVEPVDVICGGFPCQPFSLAGKRGGTADDRYLWPEMLVAILHVQPAWVIAENVPGLIGTELDHVLADLERAGYEAGTLCVPACAVGAPHIRQRVWILAYCPQHGRRARRARGSDSGSQREREQAFQDVADADAERRDGRAGMFRPGRRGEFENGGWWGVEPDVGRVAHGIPKRVDRLRGLGNAVVPQIVEWIGRHIIRVAD